MEPAGGGCSKPPDTELLSANELTNKQECQQFSHLALLTKIVRQLGEGGWHCSVSKCLKGWLEGGQTSALRQCHSFFDLENPNVGTADIADCPTE
jgi:hypothetical protein